MVLLAAVIGLSVWGYFYFKNKFVSAPESAEEAEKITEGATRGVLPSLETNPLENKPDINPADKANPIKNIKVNPFE